MSETKLDDSVFDAEINIEGYTLIRSDRNRHGGGVACYVKQHLTFDVMYYFSNEIENIFIDIFLPKTKPLTLGFFYRPPNQYNFLHLIEDDFKKLNPEYKELHILGDININTLIDNNRSIFEIRKNTPLINSLPSLCKQYIEFCSSFSLKQLISSPTRITCSSSTIIDHILTNTTNIISQSRVIDLGISDHNIIFLTRKMKKIKLNHHTYIKYCSFKNCSVSEYEERLKLVNFPNYLKFYNIDSAYSNFLNTLMIVIDSLASSMEKRIKGHTQEWFDGEISELIAIRNQQYKKFKKTLLHVDKEIFKEIKYKEIKMIKSKKKLYFERKLHENIAKPKELWKDIKSLGLPCKNSAVPNICLKDKDDSLNFEDSCNANTFKKFFENLADDLVLKLSKAPNLYTLSKTLLYYNSLGLSRNSFKFFQISEEDMRKYLINLSPIKASGIDNLSGKFL